MVLLETTELKTLGGVTKQDRKHILACMVTGVEHSKMLEERAALVAMVVNNEHHGGDKKQHQCLDLSSNISENERSV